MTKGSFFLKKVSRLSPAEGDHFVFALDCRQLDLDEYRGALLHLEARYEPHALPVQATESWSAYMEGRWEWARQTTSGRTKPGEAHMAMYIGTEAQFSPTDDCGCRADERKVLVHVILPFGKTATRCHNVRGHKICYGAAMALVKRDGTPITATTFTDDVLPTTTFSLDETSKYAI